jgi:hypothetical protein
MFIFDQNLIKFTLQKYRFTKTLNFESLLNILNTCERRRIQSEDLEKEGEMGI